MSQSLRSYRRIWGFRSRPRDKARMAQFLKDHMIAVGYLPWVELDNISESDLIALMRGDNEAKTEYVLNSKLNVIRRFVNMPPNADNMLDGDLLLVLDEDNIYLGILDGPYIPSKDQSVIDEGYPHQRTVQWLTGKDGNPAKVNRNTLSATVRSAMRAWQTAFSLQDYADEILPWVNRNVSTPLDEASFGMTAPAPAPEVNQSSAPEASGIEDLAEKVLRDALNDPDPMVRLRAVEIVKSLKK